MFSSEGKDGLLTCSHAPYDSCMYSALERHMVSEHGCVAPYIVSDKEVCTDPAAVNGTFWIAWNRVTNQFNDCLPPCDTLPVGLGGKNTKEVAGLDHGKAFFYFRQRVVLNHEHYFYG